MKQLSASLEFLESSLIIDKFKINYLKLTYIERKSQIVIVKNAFLQKNNLFNFLRENWR